MPVVHIEYHRRDLRMHVPEFPDKVLLSRKFTLRQYENKENLPGFMSRTDQNMPKKAPPAVFIVIRYFECPGQLLDIFQNFFSGFRFNETVPYRNNGVGALGIDPGLHFLSSAFALEGACAVDLISVMVRIVHSFYAFRDGMAAQKASDLLILDPKGLFIRLPHIGAGAAFFLIWAGIDLSHSVSPVSSV